RERERERRKCGGLTWLSLPDAIYILRNTQSDSHRLQLYKAEPSEGRVYQEAGTHHDFTHPADLAPGILHRRYQWGHIHEPVSPGAVSETGTVCNHHLYGQIILMMIFPGTSSKKVRSPVS
ncbi:hypothetical protein chiPu_0030918, partial [Chiloscyllium punctatum]|nr:hypothetical protein [Chiloscyllium punctatum]